MAPHVRMTRRVLVVVAATICGLAVVASGAAATGHELPGVEDVVPPVAPEAAPEESTPPPEEPEATPHPAPEEGAAPEAEPAPDGGPAPTEPDGEPEAEPADAETTADGPADADPAPADPAGGDPPGGDPAGGDPAGGDPPPAEVQASGQQPLDRVLPPRPRSGSASTPLLQPGDGPAGEPGTELPPITAPNVAPPEVAPPAPDENRTGDERSAELIAAAPRPVADERGRPDLTILTLLTAGLAWYERRHRSRYRLPPA